MKRILFNGCSFVAGGLLVWDRFCQEHACSPDLNITWTDDNKDLIHNYITDFRKKYNLPAMCGEQLQKEIIDLSMDGNSNENISFDTINYLETLNHTDVKNLLVCIGWTSILRRYKWSDTHNSIYNLHVGHLNDRKYSNWHSYIEETIVKASDVDHVLNFISSVRNLEYYCKYRNIPFLFWKSISGTYDHKIEVGGFRKILAMNKKIKKVFAWFDDANWYDFEHHQRNLWIKPGWFHKLEQNPTYYYISNTDPHPNLNAINEFATGLCNQIRTMTDQT